MFKNFNTDMLDIKMVYIFHLAFCQGLALICVSALMVKKFASQNLLRLWQKTRFARLSPPVDSRAFGAQYSRSALLAYFSQTMLNRVLDKDYLSPSALQTTNKLQTLLSFKRAVSFLPVVSR